ncbi:MAG: nucleotidyltransferase family protein [Gemmatimonadaceae bacterium]|nr:nucleotidyltransferase family protein [Gemmatimonadaceae bacterium]
MRAELRLLLWACRAPSSAPRADDAGEGARLAAAVTDWEWVLAAAARHAVTPLLARRLAATSAALPPTVGDALRARFDENALRNLLLTRALVELLERFDAAAVPVIPLKGPVLACAAYGDIALRQFLDLDLLVRRADAARARALLVDAGFAATTPLDRAQESALEESDYHQPFARAADGTVVELHWSLGRGALGAGRGDPWAWNNAPEVELLGRAVRMLSWEALLVYLCIHGSKHEWAQLGWIADVAHAVAAAPAIDWDHVAQLARDGARRMVALGLHLAAELLDAPIPEHARAHARDAAAVNTLTTIVYERLAAPSAPAQNLPAAIAFQCRVRERIRDRARYCATLCVAPHVADISAVALPAAFRPLYYVLRPARLLLKYAQRVARPAVLGGG